MVRPYTRSLHPQDYEFLAKWNEPLVQFQQTMTREKVPHREWHPHRFWEYSSILQQLEELTVPRDAEILDVGSGGCFFAPYLAMQYPALTLTDSMKYGDVSGIIKAQRDKYGVALWLHDMLAEDMSLLPDEKYDVTMCISTIEHVAADRHNDALHELWRVTKPGGFIFITSDYFRDMEQFERSPSRHLQFTAYTEQFVNEIPALIDVDFVGETDLAYCGDFVHSYSFVNICLRKN